MAKSRLMKRKYLFSKIVTYIVLLIFIIPVLWLVWTSLRPNIEINTRPPVWFSKNINFDSYLALLGFEVKHEGFGFGENVPFGKYFRNSIIASLGSTFFALIIGTLAAYAFQALGLKEETEYFYH